MYPEQPQTPPSTPQPVDPDYLNKIAPQSSRRPLFQKGPKLLILIGLGLVVLVIIAVVLVNLITSAQRQPLKDLAARLDATADLVENAEGTIKSSQLRTMNANLKIYLTNTQRDIATPFLSAGVDIAKIDESTLEKASASSIAARLEDARLNARFDRIYALEMSTQLEKILILMNQIITTTSNQQLKAFLEESRDNLEPTQEAMAKFNAANS